MKKTDKRTLTPKLRFPEFRDKPGWNEIDLGAIASLKNGYAFKSSEYDYAGGFRIITIANVQSGCLNLEETKRMVALPPDIQMHHKLSVGDILISMTGNVGRVCRVTAENLLLNQRVGKLITRNIEADFFYHLLERDSFRTAMQVKAAGGAQGNLSAGDICNCVLSIPVDVAEQQKIADCLSSLDGLIAAEGRKLEALRAHKKGLMQQLFPRPGETRPRLRFPEFQNAPEWECAKLSSCLKKVIDYRGKAPPKSESGVPLITAKNVRFGWLDMTNDEYIKEDKYEDWMSKGIPQAEDILFTTEAPLGNVALFPCVGKFALGQRIITLRSKAERCLPKFLFHSLLGPTMQNEIDFHSTGSTAKGIKSAVFVNIRFCYPGIKEQHRIADCLTTLDDLIAVQTQNLEALKTHKKGLIQQLFPAPEDN